MRRTRGFPASSNRRARCRARAPARPAAPPRRTPHAHDGHAHPHDHGDGTTARRTPHGHAPATPPRTRDDSLEQNLLAKNDLLAARNRGWLAGRGIRALNVMSSPGAGKTTLLVRTLADLGERLRAGVIEGDQETSLDADRIRAVGRPVIQINTGAGCHLDADMLRRGLDALDPETGPQFSSKMSATSSARRCLTSARQPKSWSSR